jgi:hypothetical protein
MKPIANAIGVAHNDDAVLASIEDHPPVSCIQDYYDAQF